VKSAKTNSPIKGDAINPQDPVIACPFQFTVFAPNRAKSPFTTAKIIPETPNPIARSRSRKEPEKRRITIVVRMVKWISNVDLIRGR
jgi:hypothetical protein